MRETRVERKCPSCGTWNVDGEEFCKSCGEPIAPNVIIEHESSQRESIRLSQPPSQLDEIFRRWRNSSNPLAKLLYYTAYTLWMIYAGILAIFLWLVAATPG